MSLFFLEEQQVFEKYVASQNIISISWPSQKIAQASSSLPLFTLENGYSFQWGCTASGSDLDAIDIFWIWNENGERIYTSSTTENPSYERVEQTEGGTVLKSQESMQKFLNQQIVRAVDGNGVLRLYFSDGSFIESATWKLPFHYQYFPK